MPVPLSRQFLETWGVNTGLISEETYDKWGERWEFYVNGMELANCFTELCDPHEQRQRFCAAREERRRLGEADYPIDEEFLAALGEVRSAAGVALGVDRLVMTLLGVADIASVRA